MSQNTPNDLNLSSIKKHRLQLSISTAGVILSLSVFLVWILNSPDIDDGQLVLLNIIIGIFGIWTLVAGVLIQIAMRIKPLIIVFTAIVALFAPWLTGIFLFTQATRIINRSTSPKG
jgi:hypothetical protein